MRLSQKRERAHSIGGVMIAVELAQPQVRAIMHADVGGRSWIVVHVDIFKTGYKANFLHRLVMVFRILVRLGGAFMIVEGGAGRDYIDHHGAAMRDGSLEQREQLLLVAGERPRHKGRTQLN